MADSGFWRKLSKKFSKLDPLGKLRITWAYCLESKRSYFAFGYDHNDEDIAAKFDVLAILGGREIDALEPRDSWLHAVRINSRSHSVTQVVQFDPATGREGPFNIGTVDNICKRSAIYCTRLQAEALRAESAITRTNTSPDPGKNELAKTEDTTASGRKRLLQDYKRECARAGVKVTDEMIAKAASRSWNDRTQVTWWKRNDPRSTPAASRRILAVVAEKPHLHQK